MGKTECTISKQYDQEIRSTDISLEIARAGSQLAAKRSKLQLAFHQKPMLKGLISTKTAVFTLFLIICLMQLNT